MVVRSRWVRLVASSLVVAVVAALATVLASVALPKAAQADDSVLPTGMSLSLTVMSWKHDPLTGATSFTVRAEAHGLTVSGGPEAGFGWSPWAAVTIDGGTQYAPGQIYDHGSVGATSVHPPGTSDISEIVTGSVTGDDTTDIRAQMGTNSRNYDGAWVHVSSYYPAFVGVALHAWAQQPNGDISYDANIVGRHLAEAGGPNTADWLGGYSAIAVDGGIQAHDGAPVVDAGRLDPFSSQAFGKGTDYVDDHVVGSFTPPASLKFIRATFLAYGHGENDRLYGNWVPVEALLTSGILAGGGNGAVNAGPCSSTNYPVTCSSGDFYHTFTDVSVPGPGTGLTLARTYNSLEANAVGLFGHGWSCSYCVSLSLDGSGTATITQDNGSQTLFTADGSGGFYTPSYEFATLTHNGDGTYTYVVRNQTREAFNSAGALTAITDLHGVSTTLTYDNGTGRLTTVTDAAGATLTFAYGDGGYVSTVTDPLSRVTSYSYDGNGNLTSVTSAGGHETSFAYDSGHLMSTMTDAAGGVVTNTYDGDGRVLIQTDPLGRETTYTYAGDNFSPEGGSTTITDPTGAASVENFVDGALTSATVASGTSDAATSNETIDFGSVSTTQNADALGAAKNTTFDGNGNATSTSDADGQTSSATFNAADQITSTTDPRGVTTTIAYNARGNPTTTRQAAGLQSTTTTLAYDDSTHPDDVTASTDAAGATTHYTYDASGNRTSVTDPLGNKTTYTYNADGWLLTSVAPKGNVAGATPADYTTTYAYDTDGNLLSVTDPLTHVTAYGYDADGRRITTTDPTGKTTTTAYNEDGETTRITQPDGTYTVYTYDDAGRQHTESDAAGNTTTNAYDALGHLSSTTDALGHITQYGYDADGRLLSMTTPNGGVTTNSYDPAGHLIATSLPTGGTTTYTYDAAGNKTAVTDPDGKTTRYGYDALGRLTTTVNPDGTTATSAYDEVGRLSSYTQAVGPATPPAPLAGGGGSDPAPAPTQTAAPAGLSNPYPSAVLADRPALYYRLDDAVAATAASDASGNNNSGDVAATGVAFGQAGPLPNETDTAALFSGGLVTEPSGAGLPVGNQDRSIETWFKTTSTAHQIISWWGTQTTNEEFEFGTDGGNELYISGQYNDAHFKTPYSVADGAWHSVTLSYSGATRTAAAYLDGLAIGTRALSADLQTTLDSTGLTVGGPECDCYTFAGSLNDFAIYPAALTATQVSAHYTASGFPAPAAPAQPENVQTSTGTNAAAVSWTAAPSGSAVDHYLVSAIANSHAGLTISVPGDQTSTTLTGLAGGTQVSVQVVAVNTAGQSPPATSAPLAPTGSAATYAQEVLTDNPSAFYRLDETATDSLADSSGHKQDAANTVDQGLQLGGDGPITGDAATSATGGAGEAQVSAPTSLPSGNASRSVEAWIKTSSTAHQVVAWWGTDAPNEEMELGLDGGNQIYVTGEYNEARFTTAHSIADGQWHHLVVTYDASSQAVTAYIDGTAVGTDTLGSPWDTVADSTGLVIGGPQYHGYYFDGSLADFAIYPTVLSAQDVKVHFIAGTDAGISTTTYTYNADGNVGSTTDPDGRTTTFAYDPNGNEATHTAGGQAVVSTYNKADELSTVSYPGTTQPTTSYNYDGAGRRLAMTDASGTSSYTYDQHGRITSMTDGSGAQIAYTYNALGQIATLRYPDGLVVTRTYNGDGTLAATTDGTGHNISFSYDADGNLTSTTFPGSVADTTTVDASDRATSITTTQGSATLSDFGYTLSAAGRVTSATDSLAGTNTYGYTVSGRVTSAASGAGSYGYDDQGNVVVQQSGTVQGYDQSGQLTQAIDSQGAVTAYAYDGSGNRVSASGVGSTSYGYNAERQLTSITAATGSWTYTYNGDGLRAKATAGSQSANDAWDEVSSDLPELLTDGTNDYIYGPLGNVVAQIDSGTGGATYLHADRLLGTRLLTDSAGSVTGTYSYDAYGQPTHTGTTTTPFQYSGQYTDPTGLIYLRARYYDPATAQFLTVDPVVDDTHSAYAYAGGDPANASDPSGLAKRPPVTPQQMQELCNETGSGCNGGPISTQAASAMCANEGVCNIVGTYSAGSCPAGMTRLGCLISRFDPAYAAVAGYYGEIYAAEHGCPVLGAAFEAVLGVAGTAGIATGVGSAVAAEGGSLGGIPWGDDTGSIGFGGKDLPPLRLLHPTESLSQSSLKYWSGQSTDDIVASLSSRGDPLLVKADGTVMNGNTRLTVLMGRGYDINSLPRAPYVP